MDDLRGIILLAATCRLSLHTVHTVAPMHGECLDSEHKLPPVEVEMEVSGRPGHE